MSPAGFEEDYCPLAERPRWTQRLWDSGVEIVRHDPSRRPPAHVLFDFDGTLSLIREGWQQVMLPMMVEVLEATGTDEPRQALGDLVLEFVTRLTGKQTIYQMMRLAEEVARRGGSPREPAVYKQMYLDRLMERIAGRREALRAGQVEPREMLVPYCLELLEELRRREVTLYLASGTDEEYVVEEARLLGLDRFFGPHIYGATDDYRASSKAMVIQRILAANRVPGGRLLGFGDGYVEIQAVKAVGGTAVAVASDEAGRSGKPDPWKRERLIGAGADLVMADYRDYRPLARYLWNESQP